MSYFPQAFPSRPCYVLLDQQNRPSAVIGGVTVTDTGDRENPPPPVCGLNIDGTPLGRGHVMALQLGGPDVAENIVPQYQQWQQIGAWRQMEVAAAQHAPQNAIFVVMLEYGNTGDATANGLYDTFRNDDPLVYWNDLRISDTISSLAAAGWCQSRGADCDGHSGGRLTGYGTCGSGTEPGDNARNHCDVCGFHRDGHAGRGSPVLDAEPGCDGGGTEL